MMKVDHGLMCQDGVVTWIAIVLYCNMIGQGVFEV